MSNVREEAERIVERWPTGPRLEGAQVLATLDLADAIREAGRDVKEGLDNIDSSVSQLANALSVLDLSN